MSSEFSLSSGPGLDVWKKPPSHDVFDAPSRTLASNPSPRFHSAQLTFSAPYVHQFDQAGLLLTITHPSTSRRKWIKAGIELFDARVRLSTVACDNWADWSVADPVDEAAVRTSGEPVAILIERKDVTLWVYRVATDGSKVPLREIAWVFGEKDNDEWQLDVGAAVARPGKDTKDELTAKFWDFKVEWKD